MVRVRKAISPVWYYGLVSGITSLVFILSGLIVFSFFHLKTVGIFTDIIIIIFLLIEGGLAVFLSIAIHNKSQDIKLATKFMGRHLGRVYGCLIGGFLGATIAKILGRSEFFGLAAGVLLLFFAGRWAGGKVSVSIGKQIGKIVSIADAREQAG